jgi:hypothetical protein
MEIIQQKVSELQTISALSEPTSFFMMLDKDDLSQGAGGSVKNAPASAMNLLFWSSSANYEIDHISDVYTTVNSNSANWQNVYTTVQSNSANNWSGGLTLFTTVSSAVTPNNVINVHALSATSTQTNVDVAIIAKGTGAVLAQIPDNTTAGGAKRGIYATDLQKARNGFDSVASGDYSVIAGGRSNKAGGAYSMCTGGYQNSSTGIASTIVGGESNIVSGGLASIGGGYGNSASGGYSVIPGGYGNSASGGFSTIGGGYGNSASGGYSVIPGGYGAVASTYGQYAFSSSYFENPGDAQHFQFVLYGESVNANPVILDQQKNDYEVSDSRYVSLFPNGEPAVAIMTIQIIGISNSDSISYYLKKIIVSKLTSVSYNEAIELEENIGSSTSAGGAVVVGISSSTLPEHAFYISGSSGAGTRTRWTAHVSGVYVVQPSAYP